MAEKEHSIQITNSRSRRRTELAKRAQSRIQMEEEKREMKEQKIRAEVQKRLHPPPSTIRP